MEQEPQSSQALEIFRRYFAAGREGREDPCVVGPSENVELAVREVMDYQRGCQLFRNFLDATEGEYDPPAPRTDDLLMWSLLRYGIPQQADLDYPCAVGVDSFRFETRPEVRKELGIARRYVSLNPGLAGAIAMDLVPWQIDFDTETGISGSHFARYLIGLCKKDDRHHSFVGGKKDKSFYHYTSTPRRDLAMKLHKVFGKKRYVQVILRVEDDDPYETSFVRPFHEVSTGEDLSAACGIDVRELLHAIFGDEVFDDIEHVLFHVTGVYGLDQSGEIRFVPANELYQKLFFGDEKTCRLLPGLSRRVEEASYRGVGNVYLPKLEEMIWEIAREMQTALRLPPDEPGPIEEFCAHVNESTGYQVNFRRARWHPRLKDEACRAELTRFLEEHDFWLSRFFPRLEFGGGWSLGYGEVFDEKIHFDHPVSVRLAVGKLQRHLLGGDFAANFLMGSGLPEKRSKYGDTLRFSDWDLGVFTVEGDSPAADTQRSFVHTIHVMRLLKSVFKKITWEEDEMYAEFFRLFDEETLTAMQVHLVRDHGYPHVGGSCAQWGAHMYLFVVYGAKYLSGDELPGDVLAYFQRWLGGERLLEGDGFA